MSNESRKSESNASTSKDGQNLNVKDKPIGELSMDKKSPLVDESEEANSANVDDNVKEGARLMSIKDIIDALSILLSSSKIIEYKEPIELIDVMKMHSENPKEVDKLDVEIDFISDASNGWCLSIYRQRPVKLDKGVPESYPEFIKVLHHLIEGTTKEFYMLFRIKQKRVVGVSSIIDPTYIGFSDNIDQINVIPMSTVIIDNVQAFSYTSNNMYDTIKLVLNPIFQKFHIATQEYIQMDDVNLRAWMDDFARRKRLLSQFGNTTIYGRNNVRWTRQSHPQLVPQFTDLLPQFNRLSVAYSLEFIFPEFTLDIIDLAQLSQNLEVRPTILSLELP